MSHIFLISKSVRSLIFIALVWLATLPAHSAADEPLSIVTTTGMIGDLATHVGGELVKVSVIMGPGVDPHLYKASYGDLQLLQSADIILYNGLHLEGKMSDVLEKFSGKKPCLSLIHI